MSQAARALPKQMPRRVTTARADHLSKILVSTYGLTGNSINGMNDRDGRNDRDDMHAAYKVIMAY